MSRPNISRDDLKIALRNANGAYINFNTLKETLPYSEVTLRTSLKALLNEGIIEVNKESRPYNYRLRTP